MNLQGLHVILFIEITVGCMGRPTDDAIGLGPAEAQAHGSSDNGGKGPVTVGDVMLWCGRCCSRTRGGFLVVHSDAVLATVLRLSCWLT